MSHREEDVPASDVAAVAEKIADALPPEPATVFPKIRRPVWDVFHDDERNEVWIGIKCRYTVKGRTQENGPIEDIELSHDQIAMITSLDAAKQETIIALSNDARSLQEKRQRQAALKSTGILDRLTAGLGRAAKTLIH